MILTYHEIVPEQSPYVYSTTVKQLQEHLRTISRLPEPGPRPAITFDDGHASHHRHALPLLEQSGTRGLFFVTAGWTDARPEYMTVSQLREVVSLGHEVQSHGWSHALLTQCSPDQLTEELRSSRQALEDRLGAAVDAISFPGGRWDARVLAACRDEGYRRVFTSDPYARNRNEDGMTIHGRAMVRNNCGSAELLKLLRSERQFWSWPRAAFACKRFARVLLGDTAYQRIWSRMGASAARAAINSPYGQRQ